jgi:putative membrane protein
MKKLLGWALAIVAVVAIACDDDEETTLHDTDREFILNASEANLAEIELGKLAVMKSSTPSVQSYGNMMATEHQTALDELDAIADDKDADLMNTLNAKHQEIKQKLTTMTGYAFDTAYMHSQIKDHETAMSLFQAEVSAGKDQVLKNYTSKYLPHIEMHHHKADSIVKTLNP